MENKIEFLKWFVIMFFVLSALVGVCIGLGYFIMWALSAGITGLIILIAALIALVAAFFAWDITRRQQ